MIRIVGKMREDYTSQYLDMLEKLSIPYFLQRLLHEKYQSQEERVQNLTNEKIDDYNKKIEYFSKIPQVHKAISNKLGKAFSLAELAKPRTPDSDLTEVAKEAATYFRQGLEMLKTSLSMQENSSPLVEYYSFLQCVKGTIMLDLDVNQGIFFSYHGLSSAETDSGYIKARVMPLGVFSALLLLRDVIFIDSEQTLDTFISNPYFSSLEEVVDNRHSHGDPAYAFIGSWLLSNLVRYMPVKWEEIREGEKDEIIIAIRDYRRFEIPHSIRNLLLKYVPHSSSSW